MYKVKIVFLYVDNEGNCRWSHQWVDWDGTGDVDGILVEYREKEEEALKKDHMDNKVAYAIIVETHDITDGKNECCTCECSFDEDDDGDCPFCGSGNWVVGCINDSFKYHCERCEQYFNEKQVDGGCPECGSNRVIEHTEE